MSTDIFLRIVNIVLDLTLFILSILDNKPVLAILWFSIGLIWVYSIFLMR